MQDHNHTVLCLVQLGRTQFSSNGVMSLHESLLLLAAQHAASSRQLKKHCVSCSNSLPRSGCLKVFRDTLNQLTCCDTSGDWQQPVVMNRHARQPCCDAVEAEEGISTIWTTTQVSAAVQQAKPGIARSPATSYESISFQNVQSPQECWLQVADGYHGRARMSVLTTSGLILYSDPQAWQYSKGIRPLCRCTCSGLQWPLRQIAWADELHDVRA